MYVGATCRTGGEFKSGNGFGWKTGSADHVDDGHIDRALFRPDPFRFAGGNTIACGSFVASLRRAETGAISDDDLADPLPEYIGARSQRPENHCT